MSTWRRNGKPASCEPCRKDKVRCDHTIPVCTRCDQRGIARRCFYHPAPLTRARERQGERVPCRPAPVTRSPRSHAGCNQSDPSSPEELESLVDVHPLPLRSPVVELPLPSGYLGPTSFVAEFAHDWELALGADDFVQEELEGPGKEVVAQMDALSRYWVHKTFGVLSNLIHFPTIEQLIREYYKVSQAAAIAGPLILNALASIRSMCEEQSLTTRSNRRISRLTAAVIQNTAQALIIPPATEADNFDTLFTGPNIRLEIFGIIYCIAGRAILFGLARKVIGSSCSTSRAQFARKMLVSSDMALQICKLLTPVNDLTVFCLYENLLLSSMVHGDSIPGPSKWYRLGELSTDIFTLGLHKDPKDSSDLPTFLLESRRRLFAAAYQLDKSIATFLGRPPRISWRHADCRLPLDISDEALASKKRVFELAHDSLDPEGWNVNGVFQRSAWIRVRFLISRFREEILELSLQEPSLETVHQLNEISHRCHLAWNSIPAHLHYNPNCWDDNLPLSVCLMLAISYLAYLYNDFLVQRLLVQQNPNANASLLNVSSDLLSTVLALGKQRGRHAIDIQSDFTWTIVLYGLSSASALVKALQDEVRLGQPFLYQGSRSEVIRNLSVFVSHLESMARQVNANCALLNRASKVFSRILDEILDPPSGAAGSDMDLSVPFGFDNPVSAEDLDLLDTMDFGVVFDQWLI